jgi:hypothetical protein
MANKVYSHSLELIVPHEYKSKIGKLMEDTRSYSVKSQVLILNNRSQQDSIVYKWNFNTPATRDIKQSEIIEKLSAEYFTNYEMVVT